MSTLLVLAFVLSHTAALPAARSNACAMTPEDRSWIESALQASKYIRTQRLHIEADTHPTIVLFNAACRFEAKAGDKPEWVGTPHTGKIRLPDGSDIPAGVVSSTGKDDKTGEVFFVMALPSVWKAANVHGYLPDSLGLKGVFLHEFTHVTQLPIIQPAFDSARAHFTPPPNMDDDAAQRRFEKDPIYVAVIDKERDLLFKAAHEPDSTKAKNLARQAYVLMRARQDRWFVGNDAAWKPYDDIFLTMEGLGQWVAYSWLSDPRGAAMKPIDAENGMRGGHRWWSQDEGLGLFLVIDRFLPNWASQAFAKEPVLGIDMLKEIVGA
jgi:hypothetical protein